MILFDTEAIPPVGSTVTIVPTRIGSWEPEWVSAREEMVLDIDSLRMRTYSGGMDYASRIIFHRNASGQYVREFFMVTAGNEVRREFVFPMTRRDLARQFATILQLLL